MEYKKLLEEAGENRSKISSEVERSLFFDGLKAYEEACSNPNVNYEISNNRQRDYISMKKYTMMKDPPNPSMRTAVQMNRKFPITGVASKLKAAVPREYKGVTMYEDDKTEIDDETRIRCSAACLNFYSLTHHNPSEEDLKRSKTAFRILYADSIRKANAIRSLVVRDLKFTSPDFERRRMQTNYVSYDVPQRLQTNFVVESCVPWDVSMREKVPEGYEEAKEECREIIESIAIKQTEIKAKVVKQMIDKKFRTLPTTSDGRKIPQTGFATVAENYVVDYDEPAVDEEALDYSTMRRTLSYLIKEAESFEPSPTDKLKEYIMGTTVNGSPLPAVVEKCSYYSPEVVIAKTALGIECEVMTESGDLYIKRVEGSAVTMDTEVKYFDSEGIKSITFRSYVGEEKFYFRTKDHKTSGFFKKNEGLEWILFSGRTDRWKQIAVEIMFFCRDLPMFRGIPNEIEIRRNESKGSIIRKCKDFYKEDPRRTGRFDRFERGRNLLDDEGKAKGVGYGFAQLSKDRVEEPHSSNKTRLRISDEMVCRNAKNEVIASPRDVEMQGRIGSNVTFKALELNKMRGSADALYSAFEDATKVSYDEMADACETGHFKMKYKYLLEWLVPKKKTKAGEKNTRAITNVVMNSKRILSQMFREKSVNRRDMVILWVMANMMDTMDSVLSRKDHSVTTFFLIDGKFVDITGLSPRSLIKKSGKTGILVGTRILEVGSEKSSVSAGMSEHLIRGYMIFGRKEKFNGELTDMMSLSLKQPETAYVEMGGVVYFIKKRKTFKHSSADVDYQLKKAKKMRGLKGEAAKIVAKMSYEEATRTLDKRVKRKRDERDDQGDEDEESNEKGKRKLMDIDDFLEEGLQEDELDVAVDLEDLIGDYDDDEEL